MRPRWVQLGSCRKSLRALRWRFGSSDSRVRNAMSPRIGQGRPDAVVLAMGEAKVEPGVGPVNVEAVGIRERSGSRLAAPMRSTTRPPRGCDAVQLGVASGGAEHRLHGRLHPQRFLDRARGQVGSWRTAASWSGCWHRSCNAAVISFVVVSLPATRNCEQMLSSRARPRDARRRAGPPPCRREGPPEERRAAPRCGPTK